MSGKIFFIFKHLQHSQYYIYACSSFIIKLKTTITRQIIPKIKKAFKIPPKRLLTMPTIKGDSDKPKKKPLPQIPMPRPLNGKGIDLNPKAISTGIDIPQPICCTTALAIMKGSVLKIPTPIKPKPIKVNIIPNCILLFFFPKILKSTAPIGSIKLATAVIFPTSCGSVKPILSNANEKCKV